MLISLPLENKKKGWTSRYRENPASLNCVGYFGVHLALADSKYFRATGRAYTLGCRPAVLHSDIFSILYFPLGLALHAISLHVLSSLRICIETKPFDTPKSSGIVPC